MCLKYGQLAKPDSAQTPSNDAQPGTVLKLHEKGIVVKTGDGTLTLLTVQPSGKRQWMRRNSCAGRA